MDSVLYGTLIIAGFVAAPVVAKTVAMGVMKYIEHRKKKKIIKEKRRMLTDKNYRERMLKQKKLSSALDNKNTITFRNGKTGRSVGITVKQDNKGDQLILKGTLRCKCSDGVIRSETIYLYQPKITTLKGVQVGPLTTKDGHLRDTSVYAVKLPDTGEIATAYVPKREVVSGLNYDLVRGSKNFQEPRLSSYIDIEIPKDAQGNYIPVDLTNPTEAQEFKKYVERHKKHAHGADGYFGNIYGEAERSAAKGPELADAMDIKDLTGTTAKTEVVEKVKPKEEKTDYGYDYYDRFNYHRPAWMGEHGTDYAYNLDLADHVFGPDHPGPGPMGPGHGGRRR